MYIDETAECSPFVEFHTSDGPIVIDRHVKISAFSLLKGPLYIGPNSIVDKAFIYNTRVGSHCKLSGEIGDCIIGNYTNKHHNGFVGHSLIGNWVNLGAGTNTSDLKNNYGNIRLETHKNQYITKGIKFGSIIGDYSKTGIGTFLNTGTILDIGAVVFHRTDQHRYYPSFYWGIGENAKYEIDKFIVDITKIMKRRNQTYPEFIEQKIHSLYHANESCQ